MKIYAQIQIFQTCVLKQFIPTDKLNVNSYFAMNTCNFFYITIRDIRDIVLIQTKKKRSESA